MTDLIEIVARAICTTSGIKPDTRYAFPPSDPPRVAWQDYTDGAKAAIATVLEEAAMVDPTPEWCPKHCNRGMLGMDGCNTCGVTGSVFRVGKKLFPNTQQGYADARSAAIRALGDKL